MFDLQANRARFTLDIATLRDEIHVVAFKSKERLSRPFEFQLELASEAPEIDFEQVISQPALLSLYGRDEPRVVHALIVGFEQGDSKGRFTTYHATLAPRIWYLRHRHNCRIFQHLEVPRIIEQVLKDAGFTGDDYRFALQKSYPVREYCVQYRESELNFIRRLMEEEGIAFFFEHSENNHVLVMSDGQAAFTPIAGEARVIFHPPTGAAPEQEHIFRYRHTQRVRPGSVTYRDYHFKKPDLNLQREADGERETQLELYDYPGRYDDPDVGQRRAQVRLEAEQAPRRQGRGESDCVRFQPGYRFTMAEHGRASFNQTYLLTALEQSARQPQVLGESAWGEGTSYSNDFICIPAEVPYRPPRKAKKPRIEGAQTALVVGPEGEEIYTDEHGRVKVSFHWDRAGEANEKSSCWIRVSQAWAGAGWGGMMLPRIGQEVIVDFLEGDPDRPIITGRVYNGRNHPPYALPQEKTKSTLKSNSSKGGGGFNEIRFEDQKDEEQIFVHAERDQDIRIKNDRFEWVGHDRHLVVKHDRFEQVENNSHQIVDNDRFARIKGDDHLTVGGKQASAVGASRSFTVGGDVSEVFNANHNEATRGDYYLKARDIVMDIPTGITLECGGASLVITPSGVTLKGAQITLDGGLVKIAAGPGSSPAAGSPKPASTPAVPEQAREADTAYVKKPPAREQKKAVEAHGGAIAFNNSPTTPCTPDNPYGLDDLELAAVRYYYWQDTPRLSTENFSDSMMLHLKEAMPQERDAWLAAREGPQMRAISDEEYQASIEAAREMAHQKEQAVWRDSFHYRAAFSLQDAEMMAAADAAFAPLAARIGQGLSKLYWGVRGEQATTNAALRAELRTALEADIRSYTGRVPSGSGAPNTFKYMDGVAFRSDLKQHLAGFDGISKTKVLGTHNADNFYALQNTHQLKIVGETEVAHGIKQVEYQLPRKDAAGNLTGEYKKVEVKTVYDPAVYSDDLMLNYAQKAAARGYSQGVKNFYETGNRFYNSSFDGVDFRIALDKDKYGNVFVGNVHPR